MASQERLSSVDLSTSLVKVNYSIHQNVARCSIYVMNCRNASDAITAQWSLSTSSWNHETALTQAGTLYNRKGSSWNLSARLLYCANISWIQQILLATSFSQSPSFSSFPVANISTSPDMPRFAKLARCCVNFLGHLDVPPQPKWCAVLKSCWIPLHAPLHATGLL
jgi:hypothetical protein